MLSKEEAVKKIESHVERFDVYNCTNKPKPTNKASTSRIKYNPTIHHRRSIRLKGYDYSQAGMYFVTICIQNRKCLFGNVVGADLCVYPEMMLNDAGKMIEKWCAELSNKFSDITIDIYVIMPNHFHAIIVNNGPPVGANLCVRPIENNVCADTFGEHNDTFGEHNDTFGEHNDTFGEHIGSPLHSVIQWFKTMTTNEYIRGIKSLNWQPFNKKLWQRNYWENIIRNEKSYQRIVNYIMNNPSKWENDKFYVD